MAGKRQTKPRKLQGKAARAIVLKSLRDGASRDDAACLAGACGATLFNEMKADKEFRAAVVKADVQGKQKWVKNAGEKRPDWMLAMRYPDEYARKDKYTLKQIDDAVQKIFSQLIQMIPEELRDAAAEKVKDAVIAIAIQGGELPS